MASDLRFDPFLYSTPTTPCWASAAAPTHPLFQRSPEITRLALASTPTTPMTVESEIPVQRPTSTSSAVSIPNSLLCGLSKLVIHTKGLWSEFNDRLDKLDLMMPSPLFLDKGPSLLIEHLSDLQKALDSKSKGQIALKISELLKPKKEGIQNVRLYLGWEEVGVNLIRITDPLFRNERAAAASFPDEDSKEQDLNMEAAKSRMNKQLERSFQIGATYLNEFLTTDCPDNKEKNKQLALKWFEKTLSAAETLKNKEMQGKTLLNIGGCYSSSNPNEKESLIKGIGYVFAASHLGDKEAKKELNHIEHILYHNWPLKRALTDWYSDKEYPLIPTQPIREWISSLYDE